MTRAIVTPPAGPSWVLGVRFRPGAATSLLGVSARELRDLAAPVHDVWGASGRALEGRLSEARDAREAREILEGELLARLARAPSPDVRLASAIEKLCRMSGELPIPAVAASVSLGERQLERLFDERVGYGPKIFARIVRLERAVAAIRAAAAAAGAARTRGSVASWASFAVSAGYADQAHLIREFRALTGVTPAVYASSQAMSEIDNPAPEPLGTVHP